MSASPRFVIDRSAWFAYVLLHTSGGMMSGWLREVTREGATTLRESDWYNYALIFPGIPIIRTTSFSSTSTRVAKKSVSFADVEK